MNERDEPLETLDAELVLADPSALAAASDDFGSLLRRPRQYTYDPPPARPLSKSALELVMGGIPENTRDAYQRAWKHYRDWGLDRFGERVEEELLPSRQETMIEYLDSLRRLPVHNRCAGGQQASGDPCLGHRPAPGSVWVWYSAVRFAHAWPNPPWPWFGGKQLALAMASYSREMTLDLGWEPNKAPRAWPTDVAAMVDALDLDDEAHIRDRAIVLVNWYTGARASDLSTYRITNVAFTPKGADLTLIGSKTNKAVGKAVERRALRRAPNPVYCPVLALDAWLDVLRGKHGITQGALFRPYTRPGKVNGRRTLLRGHRDDLGFRMSGVSVSGIVQDCAVRAGIPNGEYFTCHSLRRGRATHLRELKFDSLAIGRALGWSGVPPKTYMEEAEMFDDEAPANAGFLG